MWEFFDSDDIWIYIYCVSVFLFILVLIYRYMWYQDDHIESYGYACVYIYIYMYVCKSAKKKDWLPKEKKHLFQRKQWLETDREETSKAVMAPCRNCQALWWKRAKLVLMVRRTIAITTHLPRFFLLWSMIVKGCHTFGDWSLYILMFGKPCGKPLAPWVSHPIWWFVA